MHPARGGESAPKRLSAAAIRCARGEIHASFPRFANPFHLHNSLRGKDKSAGGPKQIRTADIDSITFPPKPRKCGQITRDRIESRTSESDAASRKYASPFVLWVMGETTAGAEIPTSFRNPCGGMNAGASSCRITARSLSPGGRRS